MNRDLFLAILSMDAYNRGYNPGVKLPAGATHIGLAEILPDSEQRPDVIGRQSAGFYGIAYDVGMVAGFKATEKVVSYRGTDKLAGMVRSAFDCNALDRDQQALR